MSLQSISFLSKVHTYSVLIIFVLGLSHSSCASRKEDHKTTYKTQRDTQIEKSHRQKIVEYARYFEDKPYRKNGRDEKGFDCSGFVCYVLKNFNIELPASSHDISLEGKTLSYETAKPGDLILFGDKDRIHHVGIITEIKSNKLMVIHSSSSKGVIEENVLLSDYWVKRIKSFKDVESFGSNKLALKRR
ncbi:MAG: hypothetical protein HOP11_06090 [Saprospiraceae bacterium]|nr:hypothetical protein [Saprospiraceae bacterium]